MKTLLKDKAFFVCAIVFLLALGKVVYNRIPSQNLDLSSDTVSGSGSKELTYREKLWAKADQRSARQGSEFLPVKKSRPKTDNEWLAGKSEKADSSDIDAIFNNMAEGDSLRLEQGEHSVNLNNIPKRFPVKIVGDEGAKLIITEGTVSHFKSLVLENLTVVVDLARSKTLFTGDRDSSVEFRNSTVNGNDYTFYLAHRMMMKFKNSKVQNVRMSVQDRAQLFYEDAEITNDHEDIVVMNDLSEINVKNSRILGFGRYAFYFLSGKATLKMDNVQVSNGNSLYGGKYTESQITENGLNVSNVQETTASHSCDSCKSHSH